MAAANISTRAILDEIRTTILTPIRTAVTTPAGGVAPMGAWNAALFKACTVPGGVVGAPPAPAAAVPVTRASALIAALMYTGLKANAGVAGGAGVVAALAAAGAGAALPVPAAGLNVSVVALISGIFNGNHVVSKYGKLIFNLPKSDELVNRLVSVVYGKNSGLEINNAVQVAAAAGGDGVVSVAVGTLFSSMPAADRDRIKAMLAITPDEQSALDKWDERVDKIREVLSEGASGASNGIAAANIIRTPGLVTASAISSMPATLKSALLLKRASDPSNPITKLTHLRVAMNGGDATMRGGNANPHAPLYPRIVMNGGAHPLATYMGGAAPDVDAPVRALMARINGLRDQFKSATGGPADFPGAAATLSRLDTWKDDVKNGLNSLQENLDRLAKINAAVSQYRPGLGVDVNAMTDQQLKDLVKQADDLNKQAQKSAKQFDKLKEISDLLQQLVAKQNAAPIAR